MGPRGARGGRRAAEHLTKPTSCTRAPEGSCFYARTLLHPLTADNGPGLPTLAAAQVVGYLGYTGGHGNAPAMAALDTYRQ